MLVGRKKERNLLFHDFFLVQGGGWRQVMVSGPAGVGKTALVRQFVQTAEQHLGCFVFGKADPRRSHPPLAPVRSALNMLVKKAIADHPNDLADMAQTLSQQLGATLGQAISLVPALKFLVGDAMAQEIGKIPSDEIPNLNKLLCRLIEIFARRFKGLVIFMDDIQWMDTASHKFFAHLAVAPALPGVFLIMGFRSEEKKIAPFFKTLKIFQGLDSCLHLALKGLPRRDIKALLKFKLNTEQNLTPLSDLCFEKTRGNPFYLGQMVEELLDCGAVRQADAEWIYDLERISAWGVAENVANLIIARIRILEADVLMVLKHGACIQNNISVEVLSATTGFAPDKIKVLLWKPLQLNFLEKKDREYRFSHDKILEALGNITPLAEQIEIHKRLTFFYLSLSSGSTGGSVAGVSVFTLLYHYGFCCEGMEDPDLKKNMVLHYFDAGQEAWTQGAYDQALEWFFVGKAHYPGDIWQSDYDLALAFCNRSADCAYLSGNFKVAESVFLEVTKKAKGFGDRLAIEMVKVSCYQAAGKLEQAQLKGIEILKYLGINIPEKPSWPRVVFAILKTWATLCASRFLPGTKKQMLPQGQVRQIVKVLTSLGGIAFNLSPNKFLPYITAVALDFSLGHGSSSETPTLYIAFGMVLNKITGSIKWGKRMSRTARRVSRDNGSDSLNGKEIFLSHFFLDHWGHSVQASADGFKQGQKISLEQGDHEYYGYNTLLYTDCLLFSGVSLDKVLVELIRERQVMRRLNHPYGETILSIRLNALDNLVQGVFRSWALGLDLVQETGLATGFDMGLDPGLNPVDEKKKLAKRQGVFFDLIFYEFCAAFFVGKMDAAAELMKEMEPVIGELAGTPPYYYYYFMAALVEISIGEINQGENRKKQKKYLKILKWCAGNNPGVYGPKYMIAKGEFFRIQGRLDKAEQLFEAAKTALSQNEDLLYEKGLVNEKLCRIALSRGDTPGAETFFQNAEKIYRQWGLKYKQGLFERTPADGAVKEMESCLAPMGDFENGQETLETLLLRLLDISGAQSVHAVALDALQWKTRVQVTRGQINYPVVFMDLPDKMLTFACISGKVLCATLGDSEEEFFDTTYFFRHYPTSLVVIPGGQNKGVFIENPTSASDMSAMILLAEKVFEKIEMAAVDVKVLAEKGFDEISRLKSCCKRLQDHMARHHAYEDPNLSLGSLSASLDISRRMITDAVNTCLGQNFQTYINNYRIEAAKAEMRNPANGEKTVLEIAFEQGFNSKSAFNRSFKKQTGMTPSEYRAFISPGIQKCGIPQCGNGVPDR